MLRTMSVLPILLVFAFSSRRVPEKITLIAGGGTAEKSTLATQVRLVEPFSVGFDAVGNLYLAEMEGGERVRKVDRRGKITTVVGTGEKGFSGDRGLSTQAQLNGPHHLLVLPNGDILLADTFNNRVRFIDHRTGIITTIAGTGEHGFSGDGGLAVRAQFGNVFCLALSANGERLYLCDLDNRRIRVMDRKSGTVSTVAGNGQRGIPEDGQEAINAPLIDPRAIAVDAHNNLYILERGGNALRVVTADGKIRTVIGAPGHEPEPGIGALNGPKHLCVDRENRVFIADTENHRILRYDPRTQKLQSVAGTGKPSAPGASATADLGGSAQTLLLSRPHGVFVRRDGTLYIADSDNGRILSIRP